MKKILIPLAFIGSGLLGLNIGLSYGLTAKPTLDISQCQTVIRYEDGSITCDPDGKEPAPLTDDSINIPIQGEYHGLQAAYGDAQQTIDGAELQPASQEWSTGPKLTTGEYQEVGCDDIVRSEAGLRCEVFIEHEDDNIRIFRGQGSIDDDRV